MRMVLRSQAGRTVVLAARRQGGAMESFDERTLLGPERQVKTRRFLFRLEQAERSLAVRAHFDAQRSLLEHVQAERRECLQIEGLARGIIADAEHDVVEHVNSWGVRSC